MYIYIKLKKEFNLIIHLDGTEKLSCDHYTSLWTKQWKKASLEHAILLDKTTIKKK